MQSNQIFQYNIAASGMDVDWVVSQLENYGITDIQVERGPNVNGVSVSLYNPTSQQLQAVRDIFEPLEQNLESAMYRVLRPDYESQYPRIQSGSQYSQGPRIQELPNSPMPIMPMSTPQYSQSGMSQYPELPPLNLNTLTPPKNVEFEIPQF